MDPEVKIKPKKLPSGLCSWIAPVLFYDEDEMLTVAGMDAVVMSRLLSYGEQLLHSRRPNSLRKHQHARMATSGLAHRAMPQ